MNNIIFYNNLFCDKRFLSNFVILMVQNADILNSPKIEKLLLKLKS